MLNFSRLLFLSHFTASVKHSQREKFEESISSPFAATHEEPLLGGSLINDL